MKNKSYIIFKLVDDQITFVLEKLYPVNPKKKCKILYSILALLITTYKILNLFKVDKYK